MTKLIAFPTVSRDSNLPLIEWVETYLTSHGITSHVWPDPDQPHKAALFAHVGPDVEGAVVLSGHTDVVPLMANRGTRTRGKWLRKTANTMGVAPVT